MFKYLYLLYPILTIGIATLIPIYIYKKEQKNVAKNKRAIYENHKLNVHGKNKIYPTKGLYLIINFLKYIFSISFSWIFRLFIKRVKTKPIIYKFKLMKYKEMNNMHNFHIKANISRVNNDGFFTNDLQYNDKLHKNDLQYNDKLHKNDLQYNDKLHKNDFHNRNEMNIPSDEVKYIVFENIFINNEKNFNNDYSSKIIDYYRISDIETISVNILSKYIDIKNRKGSALYSYSVETRNDQNYFRGYDIFEMDMNENDEWIINYKCFTDLIESGNNLIKLRFIDEIEIDDEDSFQNNHLDQAKEELGNKIRELVEENEKNYFYSKVHFKVRLYKTNSFLKKTKFFFKILQTKISVKDIDEKQFGKLRRYYNKEE